MTNEELDKARAKEAWRIHVMTPGLTQDALMLTCARLAREGWTPPEPVDPDVLAFREWKDRLFPEGTLGEPGDLMECAYRAGAREANQHLIDAARLEGIRLGLEAAAKAADAYDDLAAKAIQRIDPETIAKETAR